MIHLTTQRYVELLRAEYKLLCLEAYGVDNWSNYENAMTDSIGNMPSAWEFCNWPDDRVISYWEELDQ